MPRLTIDFWKPMGQGDTFYDLCPVLCSVALLPPAKRMLARGTQYTDYLIEATGSGNVISGRAARIRRENLPERINLATGDEASLNLALDEGLAEDANFLFDRDLQVLLIQRNALFRISALQSLISELGEADFLFEPVLRKDAWERFGRIQRLGQFEFHLVNPTYHPDFSRVMPALNASLEEFRTRINAVTAELRFTVGRSRTQSLQKRAVAAIARLLSREGEGTVSKLVASGSRPEGGGSEIVDFMRDRLVFFREVPYSGDRRRLDASACRSALTQALAEERSYLRSLL